MKKIGLVLLIIVLLVFNFIIGANEKGLRVLPISALMTLIVLFLIIFKIKNRKENIIFKSKVDFFVLGFMCVTFLPLIFQTYASFSDTIEFIMKYFFIYSVYILARNVLTDKKSVQIIISSTLILSFIPVVLEFDYLHTKIFEGFMEWLDIIYKPETEFSGTFGYANAQAVYLALCVFLAIYRFKNNNNKILKVLDILYIIFATVVIFFAQAKSIIIIMAIIFGIMLIIKYKEFIVKHKAVVISSVCALIAVGIGFMIFALNTPGDIVKDKKEADIGIKYNFVEGEKYKIEFDIKTLCYDDIEKFRDTYAFKIQLLEGNKYFNEFNVYEQTIENYDGKYEIEYTAERTTDFVRLKVLNNCKGYIKVNNAKINGKDYILNYKFLPNEIGYIFSGFIFNGQSLRQRIFMYSDSIKIAEINPIVGNGGDAWKSLCSVVQDYPYEVKETHSYFFELLISYGIIGVIAFLSFVIYLFVKNIKEFIKDKEKRKDKLFIFIGLAIILVHSITFDFDMSFMLIQLLVYIYTAAVLYDNEEEIKKIKFVESKVIIFLIVILSLYIRADIAYYTENITIKHEICSYNKNYYYQSNMIKADVSININYKNNLNETMDFINKEPYYAQNKVYYNYFRLIYCNLDDSSKEEVQKYLEFGIDKLSSIKLKKQKSINDRISRAQVIVITINELDNKYNEIDDEEKKEILEDSIVKLKDLLKKEYDENIETINDIEVMGYSKYMAYEYERSYQYLLDKVKGEI